MKRAVLSISLVLCIMLCACGGNGSSGSVTADAISLDELSETKIQEPQIGTYVANRIVNKTWGSEHPINETAWGNIYLDLSEDGTCTYIVNNKSTKGTWSYVLDTIYFSVPGKLDCFGSVKNGVMYLTNCPTDKYYALFFLDGAEINEADIPHIYHPSTTEVAFNHANNINKKECEKKANGRYQYYTINYDTVLFRAEDCNEIQGMLFISKDAFFNIFASGIQKFLTDSAEDYKFYAKDYFGISLGVYTKPETRAEALKLVEKVSSFMKPDIDRKEILKAIEKLTVTEGAFDYKNEKYEFTISDIESAAKELGVSKEMFGYILAYLCGGSNSITFDETTISFHTV